MSYSIYLAQKNSDMTEGRGPMVTIAAFAHRDDALKAVKGRGVMGAGDGEVKELLVHDSFGDYDTAHVEKIRIGALAKLSLEEQRSLGL